MSATDDEQRFFVVTGGPGSGKTTLIEALRSVGFAYMAEAGRGIIRDQMAIDGGALPWRDPALFAEVMLAWDIRSYRLAQQVTAPMFFDRGIPDVAGYLRLLGRTVPPHVEAAVAAFRYNRHVFVAPPWPEIFCQDDERRQDFGEAIRTYDTMTATYRGYGYELIELPRAAVAERVRFIVEALTGAMSRSPLVASIGRRWKKAAPGALEPYRTCRT